MEPVARSLRVGGVGLAQADSTNTDSHRCNHVHVIQQSQTQFALGVHS